MSRRPPITLSPRPSRRRVLLRDIWLVLLLNAVVALLLLLLALAGQPAGTTVQRSEVLFTQMVFAQAIGFSIFGPVEWLRLTRWWQRRPTLLGLSGTMALAIPSGYVVGVAIGQGLLGLPVTLPQTPDPGVLLVLLLTVLASLIAVHLLTQRDRLEAERLRAENADVRAASARLQLLQQQIEPHMLFNTLANVHALIEAEPARAQHLLEALSELLHASMQAGEQALVALQQEFNLVEHYLKLMAIRMGPRLHYTLSLPVELQRARLPPLSLQPLVENAVKHGIDAQIAGGRIDVAARRDSGQLIIEVLDDGRGLQVDDPFAGGRIGLKNVRQRLAYAFGDRASLTLADRAPQGVRATLVLPADASLSSTAKEPS